MPVHIRQILGQIIKVSFSFALNLISHALIIAMSNPSLDMLTEQIATNEGVIHSGSFGPKRGLTAIPNTSDHLDAIPIPHKLDWLSAFLQMTKLEQSKIIPLTTDPIEWVLITFFEVTTYSENKLKSKYLCIERASE